MPTTATIRPGAVTWRAGRDGIAHAVTGPKTWDAPCGVRIVTERLAWPLQSRCLACLEVVGVDVSARVATPEQETLEGWAPGELTEVFGR